VTLQHTHSYWSNPVQDKLCGPEKVISWSDPVAVIHWYTCQMTMAHSQARIGKLTLFIKLGFCTEIYVTMTLLHDPVLCCLMTHMGNA